MRACVSVTLTEQYIAAKKDTSNYHNNILRCFVDVVCFSAESDILFTPLSMHIWQPTLPCFAFIYSIFAATHDCIKTWSELYERATIMLVSVSRHWLKYSLYFYKY